MATSTEEKFLTTAEQSACEAVAANAESPHNQRAQAMLALNDGVSQSEAAERSGLTPNQVRFWMGRFRTGRLAIFPDEALTTPQEEPAAPEKSVEPTDPEPDVVAEVVAEPAEEATPPAKKEKSAKKKSKKKEGKKKKVKAKKAAAEKAKKAKSKSKKKKDAKKAKAAKKKKKGKK